uniref:FERM domain-containing protein 4A-like n=1 Tax=Neolamprologus brichardi TaxID=32507 RepID=A0A3Q4MHS2_NEOBR
FICDDNVLQVRESVWGGEQESSSEEGGGGEGIWDTQQRERMVELQERRRSLQALLSSRLAELRRICLQEAELTGAVPSDFPLEAGEKPPCVRRRGGTSRQGNRKCREDEETSVFLLLFSLCFCVFPDDTVRSESSSTSDSTGHDNGNEHTRAHTLVSVRGPSLNVFPTLLSPNVNPILIGAGYSDVLLDYVWGKQQQLQRQHSQPHRQPITSQQQVVYNGYSKQPSGAPPTYRGPQGDQRRVTVTRTKSCGPFLPVQQSQTDTHNPPLVAIQPDPHPHLLPPRPPQLPPNQDSQLEEATRSLHKALALEGEYRYPMNGGRRRTTHGVIQQSAYQTETNHHQHAAPHHKHTLPHSATFHGHPLHGRSVDGSLYHDSFPAQKQEVPLRDPPMDQPSPGTLV